MSEHPTSFEEDPVAPTSSSPSTKPCHYVTFSDLASDSASGRLILWCHTCERYSEPEEEHVFEDEWYETFIAMVMDHHGFTAAERESVSLAAALGDIDAALNLTEAIQRARCPDLPGLCSHW